MSGLSHACVLVNVTDQESMANQGNISRHSAHNVTDVQAGEDIGTFDVSFADVFGDFPVVTITQFFNGGTATDLNPVTENVSAAIADVQNQANGVFVAQRTNGTYYCRVLTGWTGQSANVWRSFSLTAMGPAKSS